MPAESRLTSQLTHSPLLSAAATCGSEDVAHARRESLSNVAAIAVSGWPSRLCITVKASIFTLPTKSLADSGGKASSRLSRASIVCCGESWRKPFLLGALE